MDEDVKGKGIFCDKCDVYIPNEASLAGHLKGKKHVKNIERIQKLESEAKRSLYITGFSTCPQAIELSLADYFSKYGSIAKITMDKNNNRFAILEFSEVDSVKKVLQVKEHFLGSKSIIVKPREVKLPTSKRSNFEQRHIVHTQMHPDVWKALMDADDVSSQFIVLQNKLSLTVEDKHLRNLICKLLETAFEEVFTQCEIQPFGSSVNGFGVHGCDLDLNFKYESLNYDAAIQFLPEDSEEKPNLEENQNKSGTLNVKQILSVIAGIIRQCVPDCNQVKAILTARRPVVKFHHKSSGMCCDISIGNSLAVRNTLFLRHLSDKVPYLASLVQAIRLWMKHWKLAGSNQSARSMLNNYAVTLLVLFYLYQKKEIYTLEEIRSMDENLQSCVIETWDCSFPNTSFLTSDKESYSLPELFAGFFHFYTKFEFSKNILSLKSGTCIKVDEFKSENGKSSPKYTEPSKRCFKIGALNIRDPFELNHNVAGNVGQKHVSMFIKCIRNSVVACGMKLFTKKQRETNNREPWGILNLFVDHHNKKSSDINPRKISFLDKTDLTIKLKSKNEDKSCMDLASLVLTILTEVFFIQFDLDNDIEINQTEDSVIADSSSTAIHTKYSSEAGSAVCHTISPESRKRHPEDSPVSHKRAKIVVTTPEALNLKTKASKHGTDFEYNLPVTFECESKYRVWEGRRKARRHLVQPGMGDLLDLERQISKLLVSESTVTSDTSCPTNGGTQTTSIKDSVKTNFHFKLCMYESGSDILHLGFRYLPFDKKATARNPEQDFNNFFHHLEISLPIIVAKCLKV
ncbi:speckle targeted PIP5K1A-regulated poly(A) polymerase-like [Styela clava]